ncbi:MAG TPA: DEAD/DEAH box helicase [Candidatus Limnocylindrales bacterium]
MSFDQLGLTPELLRAVADQGYTEPTPIQAQAIPHVLAGRDVLAGAQTGTGKTAAFVLPILQYLHATPAARPPVASRPGQPPRRLPRVLVLVPTRELALQVEESVRTYGAQRPVRSVPIYGGVGYEPQFRALRSGPEIVVATPGRLLDHMNQRTADLSGVEILVLDEADRMLDMGFIRDIRKVLAVLPAERQNLLFSATFNDDIKALAAGFLDDPAHVQSTPRNTATTLVRQLVIRVDRERKRDLLRELVAQGRIDQALVFTRTKHGANRLADQLERDGIRAAAIHGNRSQSQRVRALTDFKAGRVSILVATEVAARGIDIEELPHVVNFELPMVPEDYLHRIGRTGRAGSEGDAISLVCVDEDGLLRDIERLLGRRIDVEIVPGYEPDRSIRPQAIRLRSGQGGSLAPRPSRPHRSRPQVPEPHGAPLHGRPLHGLPLHGSAQLGSAPHHSRPHGSRQQGSPPHRNASRRGPGSAAPSRPGTPWRNGAPPPPMAGGHGPRSSAPGRPGPTGLGNRPIVLPGERLARHPGRSGPSGRRP